MQHNSLSSRFLSCIILTLKLSLLTTIHSSVSVDMWSIYWSRRQCFYGIFCYRVNTSCFVSVYLHITISCTKFKTNRIISKCVYAWNMAKSISDEATAVDWGQTTAEQKFESLHSFCSWLFSVCAIFAWLKIQFVLHKSF